MNTTWNKRSEGRYRRSDDAVSAMLIHLNVGWRFLVYDRQKHDYVGKEDGYDTAEEAMRQADALCPGLETEKEASCK